MADDEPAALRAAGPFIDAHICPCYPRPSHQRPPRSRRAKRSAPARARPQEGGLFLSHFTKALDAKGRLTLPAPFRAALSAEGFVGVFVHPALDAPALDCGGNRLIGEIGAMLAKMPPYAPEREDLSLALLGTSEILKLDTEGRFLLGERLRAAIGLKDEAAFVGQGDKFQIWAADAFAARLEGARSRARALRADLARAP